MLTSQKLFSLRTLLHVSLAFAACGATNVFAQAGNATNGATAYTERVAGASCQDCHGFAGNFRDLQFPGANAATISVAIQAAITAEDAMAAFRTAPWSAQKTSDVAAHLVVAVTPPPPPPFAPLPTPSATPSPVASPV